MPSGMTHLPCNILQRSTNSVHVFGGVTLHLAKWDPWQKKPHQ